MPGFDELQALWQAQPPMPIPPAEIESLRGALREYGRRINRLYIFKAAAIPIVVGYVVTFSHPSRAALAALVAVLVVAVVVVAADWRGQRAIARLDFTTVSLDFVRDTIRRLSCQCDPFGKRYWLGVATLVIFENVWVGSFASAQPWPERILGHLLATVLPLLALEFGRRVRIWRFNRQCRPLIERLTMIEKSLREEAQ